MAQKAGKTPGQRQRRVAEEVRHALVQALDRGEVRDPDVTARPVTLTQVEMSPDLSVARIFVVPLGGGDAAPLLAGLKRATPALRHYLGKALRLRIVPDLRFLEDHSFDAADHIETLLRDPRVARDLDRSADEEGS